MGRSFMDVASAWWTSPNQGVLDALVGQGLGHHLGLDLALGLVLAPGKTYVDCGTLLIPSLVHNTRFKFAS